MKDAIKPLPQRVLIPLGLTAAASAADARIHKKILGSGHHPSDSTLHNNAILIISNEEMEGITKIVKSLENSRSLFNGVSETIKNEAKEQKGGFPSMLPGSLGASLLGNILVGKGMNRAGEGIVRAVYGNKKGKVIVRVGHRCHSLKSSTLH